MFSNTVSDVNGEPIGNDENDNARRIDEVKAIVAGYYPFQEECQSNSDCTSDDVCIQGTCDGVCAFLPIDCEFYPCGRNEAVVMYPCLTFLF